MLVAPSTGAPSGAPKGNLESELEGGTFLEGQPLARRRRQGADLAASQDTSSVDCAAREAALEQLQSQLRAELTTATTELEGSRRIQAAALAEAAQERSARVKDCAKLRSAAKDLQEELEQTIAKLAAQGVELQAMQQAVLELSSEKAASQAHAEEAERKLAAAVEAATAERAAGAISAAAQQEKIERAAAELATLGAELQVLQQAVVALSSEKAAAQAQAEEAGRKLAAALETPIAKIVAIEGAGQSSEAISEPAAGAVAERVVNKAVTREEVARAAEAAAAGCAAGAAATMSSDGLTRTMPEKMSEMSRALPQEVQWWHKSS